MGDAGAALALAFLVFFGLTSWAFLVEVTKIREAVEHLVAALGKEPVDDEQEE